MKRIALAMLASAALATAAQAHTLHHRHHAHIRYVYSQYGYDPVGGIVNGAVSTGVGVVRGATNLAGGVVNGAVGVAGGVVNGAANIAGGIVHGAFDFVGHIVNGGPNFAAARARGLPSCGAYMADQFGFRGPQARKLWLARNWAHEGRATSPHPGAVAVWPHHVVKIVGGTDGRGRWLVADNHGRGGGHAYYRSLRGVIAIRQIGYAG